MRPFVTLCTNYTNVLEGEKTYRAGGNIRAASLETVSMG